MELDTAKTVARRNLYRYLSVGFSDPVKDSFEWVLEEDVRRSTRESIRFLLEEQAGLVPVGEDERRGPGRAGLSLFEQSVPPREEIREDYRNVFGLTIDEDAPPHEVEYCEKTDLFYRSQLMADVAGFYRAFGLDARKDRPERVDHVQLELEFPYYLLTKLLHGVDQGHGEEDLQRVRDGFKTFFEEHVGWWMPRFGRALGERTDSAFYEPLANLLRWFCTRERLELDLPVFRERPEPNVPDAEPEAACFDCGVSRMTQDEPAAGGV